MIDSGIVCYKDARKTPA